ncbi:MAG: rod shape-determining protein MreD [Firmicutes bacterium]|nr:rod shape-determining protein MreD [Bacillota bacterium]
MKYKYAFLWFLVAFILQSTVFHHLPIFGVTPNLVLCFAILFAFLYEGWYGMVFGVVFGLLQDLCFSQVIGLSSISFGITAFIIICLRSFLYRDSLLNLFAACVAGTLVHYFLYWCMTSAFGALHTLPEMLKMLPVLVIYHFIVMAVFYLLVGRRTIRHPQDRYFDV